MAATKSRSISQQTLSLCLVWLGSIVYAILHVINNVLRKFFPRREKSGLGKGRTVLVTTGRQAKTLHVVRALHEVGARVIVTDYDRISSSAVSRCCDAFVKLPALDASKVDEWIQALEAVLVKYDVDTVLPISTINEVLFTGAARDALQTKLPHVRWLCPTLEQSIGLDDRAVFSGICDKYGVRVPESGLATSRSDIPLRRFANGIVAKRIESTLHRDTEVLVLENGVALPATCQPSENDPWQWQRRVPGQEQSVWYACEDGVVTFSACYVSASSITQFDAIKEIPAQLDVELRRLISEMKLSGQYAFDYMVDRDGDAYVFECNPRSSSILCTVSETPMWGECFLGESIPQARTVHGNVGFVFHRNSWPFAPSRREGFFRLWDPLPFVSAELAWPLWAIGSKGCTSRGWKAIDCNIGKIILPGASPARNLSVFRDRVTNGKMDVLRRTLAYISVVFVDVSGPECSHILGACFNASSSCKAIPFVCGGSPHGMLLNEDVLRVSKIEGLTAKDEFRASSVRVVLSPALAEQTGLTREIACLIPRKNVAASEYVQIPLRKLSILHVVGCMASTYYEELSYIYGSQCIESTQDEVRFNHFVAYVHAGGTWSVGRGDSLPLLKTSAPRVSAAQAISQIQSLNVDIMLPHMFDYVGLTAYRSLFEVLRIPFVGCSGEALALSTNKGRTIACARLAGIRVPHSELLRRGMTPAIPRPFVVKPTEEDNSQGVCVVRQTDEVAGALEKAFAFGHEVLCEQFIPLGREVRTAIIEEEDGKLHMLPVMEYFISNNEGVRRPEDKLTVDDTGVPITQAPVNRSLPADIDDKLRDKLFKASTRAHVALGCRDYSIYDFRIDSSGEPHMLESSLYCSFSPKSVIVLMASAEGRTLPEVFAMFCERAYGRRQQEMAHGTAQASLGMKVL